MGVHNKKLTPKERKLAQLIVEGETIPGAYQKISGKPCEPYTPAYEKAYNLARSKRVQEAIEIHKQKLSEQQHMREISKDVLPSWENIHEFIIRRLKTIRDSSNTAPRIRLQAIETLEKINDPTQDTNLIWQYVHKVWNGLTAHCPRCHQSFPLWRITNTRLDSWRRSQKLKSKVPQKVAEIDRRLYLISLGSKRIRPEEHQSQMALLEAPERSIVGVGPARSGKSQTLGYFGFLQLLIPGSNIWLLGETYDRAEPEFKYIQNALTAAFYPISQYVFQVIYDKKTGEAEIRTRWGSLLRIKSAHAKGSITGAELELILCAEPAWVDGDLFEEVRARMSSRLGRIIALGTDKGFGGFLKRMIQMGERDMRTGKKLPVNSRTIAAGCRWSQSLFRTRMYPKDNPAYVLSELEAAKSELTAEEYASEFEGEIVRGSNLKFPQIIDDHKVKILPTDLQPSSFVLGVDQGERNFAATLVAWDGETIRFVDEMFDRTNKTIKANLIELRYATPAAIRIMGLSVDRWKITCFDADPIIDNQLEEMASEQQSWPTDITTRPKGKLYPTWREEVCHWINEMAKEGKILFCAERCDQLHEQFMDVLRKPTPPSGEESSAGKKWIVNDRWRGDHVLDAAMHALWTIYSEQLVVVPEPFKIASPVDEQKRAFEFRLRMNERRELGYHVDEDELFRETFGRPRGFGEGLATGQPGYYSDES